MSEELRLGRALWPAAIALGAGAIGIGCVFLGFSIDPKQAGISYLNAYTFGLTISLGSLALLLIGHVTTATWFVAVRRPVEVAAAITPLYALLFLPIALELPSIYTWAAPAGLDAHALELLERKRSFLNPTAFLIRSSVYHVVFSGIAVVFFWRSVRGDSRERPARDPAALAGACLPPFGLAFTFAAFDWVMSLEPLFASTVYGVYLFAGGFTAALALAALVTTDWQARGLLPAGVSASHDHALGRLLLMGVIFWAYIAFAQGVIVWISDEPDEAVWYMARTAGAWKHVFAFLIALGFGAPFLLLLSRELKRRRRALAAIAAWMLFVHWVHVSWLVLPAVQREGPRPCWLDLAALTGVGGLALGASALLLRGRATMPLGAPRLEASLRYESI